MILLDVNILVNAHRKDAPHHAPLKRWLEDLINGDQAYGLADIVLSGSSDSLPYRHIQSAARDE